MQSYNKCNIIICVEDNCYIIEDIDSNIIQNDISKLKETNPCIIDVSFNDYLDLEGQEIINNFRSNFFHIIKKYVTIEKTISPIVGFIIRRYFCPTEYFENSSFFDFNSSIVNERILKAEFNKLIHSENLNTSKFLETKNKYINNNSKLEVFYEEDFIVLRKVHHKDNAIYYLVLHNKSLYIFMMKIFDQKSSDSREKNEINFYSNFQNRCITHCYGFVENKNTGKKIGLLYEFMSNNSLKSYISQNQDKINETFILTAINRILQGIKYIHSNNLIHRDLKLDNILVDHDLNLYISDLEYIRHPLKSTDCNNSETQTNDIGSFEYQSPEQNRGCNLSFPTDIYSFGKIIKNLKLSQNISELLESIQKGCLIEEETNRLDIKEIISKLEEILIIYMFSKSFSLDKSSKQYIYEVIMIANNNNQKFIEFILKKISLNQNNQINAYYYLGFCYERGYGIDQDFRKAKKYYKLSANNNDYAKYALGYLYENGYGCKQRKYGKAIKIYEELVDRNNSFALNKLGHFYENGEGVEQDYMKAKYYYELASNLNNPKALCNLGYLYLRGDGAEKNYSEAKRCFELSTRNKNNSIALYGLGILYENGWGVDQNYSKAREYYELSSNENNMHALYKIGYFYENGYSVEQNYSKAKEYYELSAKQKNMHALIKLVYLFKKGYISEANEIDSCESYIRKSHDIFNNNKNFINEHPKSKSFFELSTKLFSSDPSYELAYHFEKNQKMGDQEEIKNYYNESAKLGNSNAYVRLGIIYEKTDVPRARYYYENAASLNISIAQFRLGRIYEKDKKDKEALYFYKLSSQNGNMDAHYKLGKLSEKEKNYKKAYSYYESAAYLGNSKAFLKLGIFNEKGLGVRQSILKAKENYQYSFFHHNINALFFLGNLLLNNDIDIPDAIEYFNALSKNHYPKEIEIYYYMDNYYTFIYRKNVYYYPSCNIVGVYYIIKDFNIKEAKNLIGKAAFGSFAYAQNNLGLLYELFLKKGKYEEYYKKAAEQHFALAEFNLGRLKENDKNDEWIDYYKKASDDEDSPLFSLKRKIYHKPLEISITFIVCLANLKLTVFYFSQFNMNEAKKYFIKAFAKLKTNRRYSKHCNINEFNIEKPELLFIYLKKIILNFPLFNLINLPNLSSEIINELNFNFRTLNMNDDHDYDDSSFNPNKVEYEENKCVNSLHKENDIKMQLKNKINNKKSKDFTKFENETILTKNNNNINDNSIIFENNSFMFDFIVSNKEFKDIFVDEINKIIKIMNDILNTPPYSIYFGWIYTTPIKEFQYMKDINEIFYEGFNESCQ